MIIEARTAPLELILYVHVFDMDGNELSRVVYLDTERMVAKQYLGSGEHHLAEVPVSSFEFRATAQVTESTLCGLLPSELQDKVVRQKHDDD